MFWMKGLCKGKENSTSSIKPAKYPAMENALEVYLWAEHSGHADLHEMMEHTVSFNPSFDADVEKELLSAELDDTYSWSALLSNCLNFEPTEELSVDPSNEIEARDYSLKFLRDLISLAREMGSAAA